MNILRIATFLSNYTACILAVILAAGTPVWAGDSGECGLARDKVQQTSKRFDQVLDHLNKVSKEHDLNIVRADKASEEVANNSTEIEAIYSRAGLRFNEVIDKGLLEDEEKRLQRDIKSDDKKVDTLFKNREMEEQKLEVSHNRYLEAAEGFKSSLKALQQAKKAEQNACQ